MASSTVYSSANNPVSQSNNQPQGPPPLPPDKLVQFRVMRLYKPPLYMSPNLPALTPNSNHVDPLSSGQQMNADFIISPYILLPDSFGDIYLGEIFSAYVAIVTGIQDIPLYKVNLTVRLQTANSNYDLSDVYPVENQQSGIAKVLQPFESLDMIIHHTLNELGTHTLRATAQFMANKTGDVTTVRKFYRFNVLQPITVVSTYIDLDGKIMIQCQVTNMAKAQLHINKVKFISLISDSQVLDINDLVQINRPAQEVDSTMSLDLSKHLAYDVHILNPSESHSYAFIVNISKDSIQPIYQSIGYPEVDWSSSFGESGSITGPNASLFQGNDESASTFSNSQISESNPIKIMCISSPASVTVGHSFDIVLRVTNHSSRLNLSLRLQSKSSSSDTSSQSSYSDSNGLSIIALSTVNIGVLQAGSYIEKTLLVYPIAAGLQEMRDIVVVDIMSGKEYVSGSLFKIMVLEQLFVHDS